MAGYALIEAVKAKKGLTSDNQLAVALGIDRNNVSGWKNKPSKPDADSLLDLMILGEIDAKEAKRLLESGFMNVSLLIVTGFASIALLASKFSAIHCILCQIGEIRQKDKAS